MNKGDKVTVVNSSDNTTKEATIVGDGRVEGSYGASYPAYVVEYEDGSTASVRKEEKTYHDMTYIKDPDKKTS